MAKMNALRQFIWRLYLNDLTLNQILSQLEWNGFKQISRSRIGQIINEIKKQKQELLEKADKN